MRPPGGLNLRPDGRMCSPLAVTQPGRTRPVSNGQVVLCFNLTQGLSASSVQTKRCTRKTKPETLWSYCHCGLGSSLQIHTLFITGVSQFERTRGRLLGPAVADLSRRLSRWGWSSVFRCQVNVAVVFSSLRTFCSS